MCCLGVSGYVWRRLESYAAALRCCYTCISLLAELPAAMKDWCRCRCGTEDSEEAEEGAVKNRLNVFCAFLLHVDIIIDSYISLAVFLRDCTSMKAR